MSSNAELTSNEPTTNTVGNMIITIGVSVFVVVVLFVNLRRIMHKKRPYCITPCCIPVPYGWCGLFTDSGEKGPNGDQHNEWAGGDEQIDQSTYGGDNQPPTKPNPNDNQPPSAYNAAYNPNSRSGMLGKYKMMEPTGPNRV